jgi:LIVCS family branched-chain amino acid:cation transporter
MITGVVVPLLGLIAMMQVNGDPHRLFRMFGKIGAITICLLILGLIGPVGVVPRCISVAFGSFKSVTRQVPFAVFSAAWCCVLYLVIPRRDKVIPVIGKYLTPTKLTALVVLVFAGVMSAPPLPLHKVGYFQAFISGVHKGYQMMDLMASFFFAMSIIHFFKKIPDITPAKMMRLSIGASFVGAALLAIMYCGFLYLGAAYQSVTNDVPSADMLPAIAFHALGPTSGYFLSFTIIVACLTTSVALIAVFTDYIATLIGQSYRMQVLLSSIIVAFFASTLEFEGIMRFLGPILEVLYPFLIVVTIGSIIYESRKGHAHAR